MLQRSLLSSTLSRRGLFFALCGAATALGCDVVTTTDDPLELPEDIPGAGPEPSDYADALDAVANVLLPAQRDAKGLVLVPGAREARVDLVLDIASFAPLAVALGFLPPLGGAVQAALATSGDLFRIALNAELDALASLERPLASFKDLPFSVKERIVTRAFEDARLGPSMRIVRAACMAAFAGGIASDVGMRAIGFPPFEDLADGIAVSGYPRSRKDGRRLSEGAAEDDVDDYTYDEAPAQTSGEELSDLLDENGDLR